MRMRVGIARPPSPRRSRRQPNRTKKKRKRNLNTMNRSRKQRGSTLPSGTTRTKDGIDDAGFLDDDDDEEIEEDWKPEEWTEGWSDLTRSDPPPADAVVSCGMHKSATGCAGCPQGHGALWCNGDCEW